MRHGVSFWFIMDNGLDLAVPPPRPLNLHDKVTIPFGSSITPKSGSLLYLCFTLFSFIITLLNKSVNLTSEPDLGVGTVW